ncbi:MAG TPA: histidine kinase [Steroidobacteraceae bacterium]|nr:histidine kinase [Steroidobacteraceae bacterium]
MVLASGWGLSKSTVFYLLHFSGWIGLMSFGFATDLAKKGVYAAALENLSWMVCGVALTLGLRAVFRRVRSRSRSYVAYALIALFFCIVGAPIWYDVSYALTDLCYLVADHIGHRSAIFLAAERANFTMSWWVPIDYWFSFSSTLFTWSSLYFGINAMLDLETERANVTRALKLADTARLRALQSNLNPHFLFNALNGIATLIREKDGTAASAMVDALSAFLRSTLQRMDTPEIQVREELQLIEQYLRIQRFRFGERLRAVVAAAPDTLEALIPTLILQPLVENAVRYGVLPREEGGCLWVSIRKEGLALVISVEDDGAGMAQSPTTSVGLGLGNSRDRLSALYGTAADLSTGRRADGTGFAVTIRMPVRLGVNVEAPVPAQALLA